MDSAPSEQHPAAFPATSWTMIAHLPADDSLARSALSELCRLYWLPLYTYVRRSGHPPQDAEDLTQAFFERLLTQQLFERADSARGKLRTFLLCSLQNFLHETHRNQSTWRRGGRHTLVAIDSDSAELHLAADPAESSPDHAFDRRWALAVIDQALLTLEREHQARAAGEQFAALKPFLQPESDPPDQAGVARQLDITEGALRVAIHRLRQRFRAVLRSEVAATLTNESDTDTELKHLVAALRRESP